LLVSEKEADSLSTSDFKAVGLTINWSDSTYAYGPLQNPILSILIMEDGGVNTLGWQQGSGPPKPRCEVSCWRLHGTEVVTAVS